MAAVPSASASSPRPSLSLRSPGSSTTSLDPQPSPTLGSAAPSQSRSAGLAAGGTGGVGGGNVRRNRAALRDYYGLANAVAPNSTGEKGSRSSSVSVEPPAQGNGAGSSSSRSRVAVEDQSLLAELDKEGFDAGGYVRNVLERETLKDVLRVEKELVSEIRGLDGERKALVYDNYSKLISATDTIRKVCSNLASLQASKTDDA
jgi:hypothetical protein